MIIAANLKTNLTRAKTLEYVNQVEKFLDANNISQEVLVFPAASSLNPHAGKVLIGAQNAYPVKNGAFTGEIGLEHLEEFVIKTILIGHSERRHILMHTHDKRPRWSRLRCLHNFASGGCEVHCRFRCPHHR